MARPRTLSTTTDANFDCAFVENALSSQQNRIELVTRPDVPQGPGGQAATASATSSVGNVSELTWSSRGDVLSEAPAASIPTSASVATSRGGWTTMSASSRLVVNSISVIRASRECCYKIRPFVDG